MLPSLPSIAILLTLITGSLGAFFLARLVLRRPDIKRHVGALLALTVALLAYPVALIAENGTVPSARRLHGLLLDAGVFRGSAGVTPAEAISNPGRGQIVICGDATTVNNNTVYYGPIVTVNASDTGGMDCDVTAAGNTTEATADAPVFTAKAFHVLGMVCRNVDTNAAVSYTLRSAAAATTPSVTCSVADGELDCVADVQTTTAIASGATIAVAVASTADMGAAAFVCTIEIAY